MGVVVLSAEGAYTSKVPDAQSWSWFGLACHKKGLILVIIPDAQVHEKAKLGGFLFLGGS